MIFSVSGVKMTCTPPSPGERKVYGQLCERLHQINVNPVYRGVPHPGVFKQIVHESAQARDLSYAISV